MSNTQKQTKYCKLNKEQKLLLLKTRLALQTDFHKYNYNVKQKSELWKQVQQQLTEKDSNLKDVTVEKIRLTHGNLLKLFKRMKTTGKIKGTWQRKVYDMFEKAFADVQSANSKCKSAVENELHQLVLNARLSRESEFKNVGNTPSLIWHDILQEVKAKTVGCTEDLTSHRVMHIFYNLLSTYKRIKRNKHKSSWPYFDQMDKIYGNDSIAIKLKKSPIEFSKFKQFVLNARLSREIEFQKYATKNSFERDKLWQDILCEVEAKATGCCTAYLNTQKLKGIFWRLYNTYRAHKRKKTGSSWPYFDQMDKIYGRDDKPLKSRRVANFSDELKQLLLNARLCREDDFKKFKKHTIERKLVWHEILCEIKEKAVGSTEGITLRQIQSLFHNMFHSYKKQVNGEISRFCPYYDQMNKIYGNSDIKVKFKKRPFEKSKLKQMVLIARLSREAEFQKYSATNTFERRKLWQEILSELKGKTGAEYCTAELNCRKIQQIFNVMLCRYKRHKNNGNRSWKYYEQMDKVYGSCEPFEIFTTDYDNDDVECNDDSITENVLKILKEKAFIDREIFQQICDIEKNKLQLQRAEIDELRKLIIILKAKQKN